MTPLGLEQLKLDEGLRLKAYPDPLTKGAPWTIGYGATGSGISKDTIWSVETAESDLLTRVNFIESQFKQRVNFFSKLSPVRQDVLVNIAYNIGFANLLRWTITLAAISRGDYATAASDIGENTVWHNQVGERCTRCAIAFAKDTWIV